MGKTLVVYFSATGNTESVAKCMAETLCCDIKRIEPVRPYNFNNPLSVLRSVVEQVNPFAHPQIKDGQVDLDPYDIVFIAEPVWLDTMPKVIETFIAENDFSDKAMVAVCTGGTSDGSGNFKALRRALPESAFIVGEKKFDEDATDDDVLAWLEEF